MQRVLSGPGRRRWMGRFALAVLCVVGLASLPVARGGDSDVRELGSELARVRDAIGQRDLENQRLRRDISALKSDPRAIERAARDQLGMAYPTELVIRRESPGSDR